MYLSFEPLREIRQGFELLGIVVIGDSNKLIMCTYLTPGAVISQKTPVTFLAQRHILKSRTVE